MKFKRTKVFFRFEANEAGGAEAMRIAALIPDSRAGGQHHNKLLCKLDGRVDTAEALAMIEPHDPKLLYGVKLEYDLDPKGE